MEVAEDVYDTNTGRIVWSIEYTKNGISKESYLTQDSKIVSQINIHNKDQQRLVPVLKVRQYYHRHSSHYAVTCIMKNYIHSKGITLFGIQTLMAYIANGYKFSDLLVDKSLHILV